MAKVLFCVTRNISLLLAMTLLGWHASAQIAVVRGVVTDGTAQVTMIGANVTYAPGKGVATDVSGRFSVELPPGDHVLKFSSIGYEEQRIPITLIDGETRELAIQMALSSMQLDMVVVSAGRFEQRLGEVTVSMNVIKPDMALNKNITNLTELLDQVPGVVVVDNEPQIRSGSGYSFGAGSRVMILVDDLPVLSGDVGRPSWSFLPIENLEQIEVIKGASSVLNGSAALSGVINIRTAYPRSEPQTRITVQNGMYTTPKNKGAKWWDENNPIFSGLSFFHSRQFGNTDLVVGGNAFSDQGYVGPEVRDPTDQNPLSIGPGGYEHRMRMNVGVRRRSKKVEGLNYGLNTNGMYNRSTTVLIWNDVDSGLYRPSPNTVTRTITSMAYLDPYINYNSSENTKHTLRARYFIQENDNDNGQGNANNFLFTEYQLRQRMELFGETNFTGGVSDQRTTSHAELYSGNLDGSSTNTASNTAAYLQIDKKLLTRIALSAGVRYEQYQVNQETDAQPVFRAGATWQALEGTYFRGSYGQGFRFPTIGEKYIRTSVGDIVIYPGLDLRPERSWNTEFGLKQGFKVGGVSGYFDAVVFQQDFENYIEFTFGQWGVPTANPFLGFGFRSVNTGRARVQGLELELACQGKLLGGKLGVLMGYTYTEPVSLTPDQVYGRSADPNLPNVVYTYANTSYSNEDNVLKYRLKHLFRSDVQYDREKWFIGGSARYVSHTRNIDKIFVTLDGAGVLPTGVGEWMREHTTGDLIVDARIGAKLLENYRLALVCNNLLNEEYALRPLSVEPPRHVSFQFSVAF